MRGVAARAVHETRAPPPNGALFYCARHAGLAGSSAQLTARGGDAPPSIVFGWGFFVDFVGVYV